MKFYILGAGAMGCMYGMYLSRQNEVLLVDVVQAHVDAINENGLEFTHLDGETEFVKRLSATTDTTGCEAKDLVILLTKGYQSGEALEKNASLIGPNTIVCSLQNGYGNADDIVKYVPEEQIDESRFSGLGVIGETPRRSRGEVNAFLDRLEILFSDPTFTKADVVLELKAFLPSFEHEEKGRNLDQKM